MDNIRLNSIKIIQIYLKLHKILSFYLINYGMCCLKKKLT